MSRKLSDLTKEQIYEVCTLHLDNYSLREIKQYISDKYDVVYTRQTYSNFFKSEEGRGMIDEVANSIRDQWINEPLAEKSSRIHALQEQATKLQRMLRNFPKEAIGSQEYYKVSSELRAYLNQLRQETEPLRLQKDEKLLSPFEWLFDEDDLTGKNNTSLTPVQSSGLGVKQDAEQTTEVRSEGSGTEEEDPLSKIRVFPTS